MDGLLIVDKPSGPTSHDVVARVRRAIGERRVGHTGTLDPLASGVLPLVIGRATRLAQLLSGTDKEYIAGIELGLATDTHDVTGQPLGARWEGPVPDAAEIDTALNRFRGTFLQQPPVFSAKKINGRRSYRIARRPAGPDEAGRRDQQPDDAPIPARVPVTVHLLDLLNTDGSRLTLRVRCSAGFYVRSLAHDLGQVLGTGAHLVTLQRTESAGVRLDAAVPLAAIEQGGAVAATAALTPMAEMVPALPAVALTDQGVRHARFGRELGPSDSAGGFPTEWRSDACPPQIRLLDPDGQLVGLARPASTPGLLHPAVILM